MYTKIAPNYSKLYFSLLETSENAPFLFWLLPAHGVMNQSGTQLWLILRPPFSTKGPFVRFNPADLTIRGNKAKTDYRNIMLEISQCKSMTQVSLCLLAWAMSLVKNCKQGKTVLVIIPGWFIRLHLHGWLVLTLCFRSGWPLSTTLQESLSTIALWHGENQVNKLLKAIGVLWKSL